MSIADKITRLQAAKTAIGTAITAKGGTVAAGDGFEDFAAAIAGIPSGGSLEHTSEKYVCASRNANSFSIAHGLSKAPKLVTMLYDGWQDITVSEHIGLFITPIVWGVISHTAVTSSNPTKINIGWWGNVNGYNNSWSRVLFDEQTFGMNTGSFYHPAGEYSWEAWTW